MIATTEIQTDLFGEDQTVQRRQNLPYAIELLRDRPLPVDAPLVVSYGGGRNSTAMLIGMWSIGMIPDLILFADTGGELPETYAYIELFSKWLVDKGMPPVTTISRSSLGMGKYETLESQCLSTESLPSKAYGSSECSVKWKIEPYDRYIKQWLQQYRPDADKIRTCKGIHAGEVSRLFNRKSGQPYLESNSAFYLYPLIYPFQWHQGHCEAVILAAGLPMPPKSACFYCPNRKPKEVRQLAIEHPDLLRRAIALEHNAAAKNKSVQGLGREYSWESLIESSKPNEYFVSTVIPDCVCNDD